MRTFEEWHKEHPTPWRIVRTNDRVPIRFVADANGNPVTMETVVSIMNSAVVENGCLEGWRQLCRRLIGTSPEISHECVAACIKSVEAQAYHDADEEAVNVAMNHAISLLPKRTT